MYQTAARNIPRSLAALALAVLFAGAPSPAAAGGDWNDAGIGWKGYDEGLAAGKAEKKPILLVFYTDWCPHCTNYSKVFHDPKVVEKSKSFVMIRLNKDQNAEVSGKYKGDGDYIPRTFFLSSDGVLQEDIHEQRPNYLYFYNESDPAGILRGMDAALAKLAPPKS